MTPTPPSATPSAASSLATAALATATALAAINPYLSLAVAVEPVVADLVKAVIALVHKHNVPPDQLGAIVQQLAASVHNTNADTLATIAADQAAHPL